MIAEWKTFLINRRAEWDLPADGEWSFLLHNNYHPHYSNLNVFWFHNKDRFPRVVAKIFKEPHLPGREYDNLKQAYACAPAWLPRPLHLDQQGQFWLLWMQGVPGTPLASNYRHSPDTLRSLVRMLGSMHSAVRKSGIQDPDRYRRLILEPLNTVAQFGASASIRDGCASVLNRVSMDWLKALPAIPQHGDLFPSNILTHRREWYVVDWESFGMVNLPFYDLLTLLLSLLQTEAETPDKWHPSLTKQAPLLIGDYARQLGLRADIPLLLPLTLANWFHLQWVDGRKEFVTRMYRTIEHYFDHRELWESVFVSRVE